MDLEAFRVILTKRKYDNVMANPTGARPWMPIGSEGTFKDGKFQGTFDGRGYTISGLYIDHTSTSSGLLHRLKKARA